jgi:hypothetical protein
MTRIERQGDTLVVEQTSWILPGMGVFFTALGALMIVAGVVAARGVAAMLLQGFVTGALGVFLLRIPGRRTTTLSAAGAATLEVRSLLGTTRRSEDKVRAVDLYVGVYNAWLILLFEGAPPAKMLTQMKTWTWETEAPGLKKQAEEIAGFLGVPLA